MDNWILRRILILLCINVIHLKGDSDIDVLLHSNEEWTSCQDYKPTSSLPNCLCLMTTEEKFKVNCDHVVFQQDFPNLPFRKPIISYSQRYINIQNIPSQIFVASGVPIQSIDLSHNWLRRLTEKSLDGLTETLEKLDLSNNLLGDQLNPIFSTTEFKKLPRLKILKLGSNLISNIDDGILDGCLSLQDFYLDNNEFKTIPNTALKGPNAMKLFDMSSNQIEDLSVDDFKSQHTLLTLNISNNKITTIQGNAFRGLTNLKILDLSWNHIHRLNSDSFNGLATLEEIHLSYNFLTQIPITSLKTLDTLKKVILCGNLIQNLEGSQLKNLKMLESLDLSRNRLNEIPRGFFNGMTELKEINLGINQLRTLPATIFEGLTNLNILNIMDNNLLTFPAAALDSLIHLKSLTLDYNRITALTPMKLQNLTYLSLSNNLIREIPSNTFTNFPKLNVLNLHGNLIYNIEELILPIEMKSLDLSLNHIKIIPRFPLPDLNILNLNNNHVNELLQHNFVLLTNLKILDINSNLIKSYYENTFDGLNSIEKIDLSKNLLDSLPKFGNLYNIKYLNFSKNLLKNIGSIENMENLKMIDLSYNLINNLNRNIFTNTTNLMEINLKFNQLNSFKGFEGKYNKLKILNLNNNQITYVYPNSFETFDQLWNLQLNYNRFTFFPTEFLKICKQLRYIGLSNNQIKNLNEMNFSNFQHLNKVDLSFNTIEFLSQNIFINSSQLQSIDFSSNKIENIDGNLFHGLSRLELNLSNNYLTLLPTSLFDRNHVLKLQKLDLSKNTLQEIPSDALQKQYFHLEILNLSDNQIIDISPNLNILVNVKNLDLSYNPINELSLKNILNEPKTVRILNLSNCSLNILPVLEMPFLRELNISNNPINTFDEIIFKRTTLINKLDISNTKLYTLEQHFPSSLKYLDLSYNPIINLTGNIFPPYLEILKLNNLNLITKVEKHTLNLKYLKQLELYNLSKLGYLDIKGLLLNLQYLEKFDFEIKDYQIIDQIHPGLNSRVNYIGLRGKRVRSISTGAFAGLTSPNVRISLMNTSLTILPSILAPVPMSSNIILNIQYSNITNLSPPFLTQNIRLEGLTPICDCNSINLIKYFKNIESNIICSGPKNFERISVLDIKLQDLICPSTITFGTTTTTTTQVPPFIISSNRLTNSSFSSSTPTPTPQILPSSTTILIQDDIIWSITPPTMSSSSNTKKPPLGIKKSETIQAQDSSSSSTKYKVQDINNMDNLIIGIVGGVVGLIVLFVIIIVCFVKLSGNSSSNNGGGHNIGDFHPNNPTAPSIISIPAYTTTNGSSKCTCPYKSNPHTHSQHHYISNYPTSVRHNKFIQEVGNGGGYPSLQQQQQQTVTDGNGSIYAIQSGNMGYNTMTLGQAQTYGNYHSPAPGYNSLGPNSYRQQQQQQQMYNSLPYFIHEDYERR